MTDKPDFDALRAERDLTEKAAPATAYEVCWQEFHSLPDSIKRKLSVHEFRQIARAVVPRVYWHQRSSSTS